MSRSRAVLAVAGWELRRFFKWRDQIGSLILMFLVAGGFQVASKLAAAGRESPEVAVLAPAGFALALPEDSRVRLVTAAGRSAAELRDAVGRRELDGLLVVTSPDRADLVVWKEPRWADDLRGPLSELRRAAVLEALGVAPADLERALAPVDLTITIHERGTRPAGRGERILAAAMVLLMLLGVWIGLAYFLVGVTGEKQLRVTEQVVSAISPQAWMDGKLLGITALALATLVNYAVTGALTVVVARAFGFGPSLPLPGPVPAGAALVFLLLAALGLLFWNCFFAAVSATISDPQTSSRGALLFLPLLPVLLAFAAVKNPDGWFLRLLSIVPGTSSAVLPARMVLTEVAWWEAPLAIALLVAAIAIARRAAGTIFATAMLLYGKEPSWREVWRWVREAGSS